MKDSDDLKRVIELYSNIMRRVCFLYMKQDSDVDDIFQNVFLKYTKTKKSFQCLEHEKAWFIRVTINECKNFLGSWFHKNVDFTYDFDQFHIEKDSLEYDIIYAIQKLEKKYKIVIYLYYYEGYSMAEIADILRKNENTIYTWHARAKDILKKELGGDYFESR